MNTIDAYKGLLKKPTFSINTLIQMAGSESAAYALSTRLLKKGLIVKIRRNLYSAVNLVTNEILASKYQIACAINPKAYLCLYSASEYHGLFNTDRPEVHVSSDTRFRSFKFQGVYYKFLTQRINLGVMVTQNDQFIRVTDLERTFLDAAYSIGEFGEFDALIHCLREITSLEQTKVVKYLKAYNSPFLYQKVGYLLEKCQSNITFSPEFFKLCQTNKGEGTRYFCQEARQNGIYDRKWHLMVPNR